MVAAAISHTRWARIDHVVTFDQYEFDFLSFGCDDGGVFIKARRVEGFAEGDRDVEQSYRDVPWVDRARDFQPFVRN